GGAVGLLDDHRADAAVAPAAPARGAAPRGQRPHFARGLEAYLQGRAGITQGLSDLRRALAQLRLEARRDLGEGFDGDDQVFLFDLMLPGALDPAVDEDHG